MLDACIGHRKRHLATSWNELTARQLLQVARLHGQSFASEAQQQNALLYVLLQVPRRVFRQLNAVQRHELRRYTRFLVDASTRPLTKQLLPKLPYLPWWRGRGARLWAPLDNFRNLRFAEFIFADTYFLRYLQTNEAACLDQLVAVLYRRQRADYRPTAPDYQGDRREAFNEHQVAARARHVAHYPHALKWAVLLWYRGCRHALERRYDYVFTGEHNSKAAHSGWTDVLHELAGGVQHLDATAQQPLHTVLREMNRLLRQAEERADT